MNERRWWQITFPPTVPACPATFGTLAEVCDIARDELAGMAVGFDDVLPRASVALFRSYE